jgi:membrane protein insertase Oxa1/YidC/SpoIIIJ
VTGLGLYFATSNIFRVGQQAVILGIGKRDDPKGKAADSGPDSDPPGEKPKETRPSPNASKKRSRRRK